MKTVVLTGATGSIGRALIEEITARGDRVLALVRPDSARAAALPPQKGLTVLPCGLSEYADFPPPVRADLFLHLSWAHTAGAGRDDPDAQVANIRAACDAVRLAARFGCTAFVGAGSQAEYGPASEPLRPDTPVHPESGYGIAKYAAGRLTRLLASQLGLRHSWARILSVYGPEDSPGALIPYLIRTFRAGGCPELTPCGQIWDFLYASDAARALLAIGERGRDGGVYPVGSGEGRPLAEYVTRVRDLTAPGAPIAFGAKPYYPHQPMMLVADIEALRADTGFAPSVSFDEGIRRMLDALDKEGGKDTARS